MKTNQLTKHIEIHQRKVLFIHFIEEKFRFIFIWGLHISESGFSIIWVSRKHGSVWMCLSLLPNEKEREICKIEMDFKKFIGVLIWVMMT